MCGDILNKIPLNKILQYNLKLRLPQKLVTSGNYSTVFILMCKACMVLKKQLCLREFDIILKT